MLPGRLNIKSRGWLYIVPYQLNDQNIINL